LDGVVLHEPDAGPAADQSSTEEVATPRKLAAE